MLTEEDLAQITEVFSTTLMDKVNVALNGYDKKLKLKLESINTPTPTDTVPKEEPKSVPEVAAIQKQLDAMKAELAEKTKAAHTASLRSELTTLLGGTISPSAVSELILGRVSSQFTQSGSSWLDAEGNDLKGYVTSYLESDEGQVFVKPTVTNVSTPSTKTSPNPAPQKDKTNDLITNLLM